MARLIADHLCSALIPDDHGASAVRLSLMNPLEVTRRQGMIPGRHGKAPDTGIKRRPAGHRPGPQDLAGLDPQVEMQSRRVVQLHDEPRDHDATVQPANVLAGAGDEIGAAFMPA